MKRNLLLYIFFLVVISSIISCAKEDQTLDPSLTPATFKGNWSVSEQSKDFGVSTYTLSISDSSNSSYILFGYLYNWNKKVFGICTGKSCSLPIQLIQGTNVSGNGTLTSSNRIDLKYYVQSSTTHFDTVIAVLHK